MAMRKFLHFLAASAVCSLLLTGCAGPEQKLGRGLRNTAEIVRWSSMERSIEQTTLWEGSDAGITTGVVKGFTDSMARTGMGIVDIVTFPIPYPSYQPWGTNVVPAAVQYPDSYKPGMREMQATATDTSLGFAGGTILPWLPGNRFRVFDYPW
jgi:putative exosortase-associated protein (TIGR04073 family)